MSDTVRGTMYEFAGGADAFHRLAEAQYRRCREDPVLVAVFGADEQPGHAERLGAWLAEVFGGPKTYSERYGGHEAMVRHHLGREIGEAQAARFVEVTMAAADEVGLPDDGTFRDRLRGYLEWGAKLAVHFSRPGAKVPPGAPVPAWDWNRP
jgi:truncated hemoglobin YjbI